MTKTLLLFLMLIATQCVAAVPSVTGHWETIDDETGKPSSIIEIFKVGDVFKGKIIKLIDPDEPTPTCNKCPGEKLDKPVLGLEIIWGMKETKPNQEWGGGEILDPRKGKSYKCRMHLIADGRKLNVRGYIGFSLLGRTQTWMRVP